MSRVKVARKSTAIDMTAMCDVAFLLLTFFILSAKPKTQAPVSADPPASTATFVIPESDFSTITIGQGKVAFNVQGDDVRRETLKQMGLKYKYTFTPHEIQVFATTESFGMPIGQLKQFLNLSNEQKSSVQQEGIPVDTTESNELADWVHEARIANKYLHNIELRVAIKGDAKEEYPTIHKVIATLQKQNVNKFSLITDLKKVPK